MTPRKKPTAVFVFGILNIVFGTMALMCNLCSGLGLGGLYLFVRAMYEKADPQAQKELDEVGKILLDSAPGIIYFMIASLVIAILLGAMQLVSGIGMVKIRNWGRWLCVAWGGLEILVVAAGLFYQIAVVTPAREKANADLEKWMQKQQAKQGGAKGGQPAPSLGGGGNQVAEVAMSVVMSLFSLVYAVLVMIFMVLPATGQAIARYNSPEDFGAPEDRPDYYDADFDRRRREPEPPSGGPPDLGPPDLGPPGDPSPWREPRPGDERPPL